MPMDTLNKEISRTLDSQREAIASAVVKLHCKRQPEIKTRYGEPGDTKCLQDITYHLSYLSDAVATSSPALFAEYIAWAKVLLAGLNIPEKDLMVTLECIRDVLQDLLPDHLRNIPVKYITTTLGQLPQLPTTLPTFFDDHAPLSMLAKEYLQALLQGKRHKASRLIMDTVQQGIAIQDIYLHVFQRSQREIGRLWQMNKISVAQEHYCSAATQIIMSQLYPYVFGTKKKGKVLIAACVGGELHEIGIRMVSDFLEMEGWDTFYMGANTPNATIIQTIAERNAPLLAISATMVFHVRIVADLISLIRTSEKCKEVKIVVGGYPFNLDAHLWKQVSADGYACDARDAVSIADQLVKYVR